MSVSAKCFLGHQPGTIFFFFLVNFSYWGILDYSGSRNSNPSEDRLVVMNSMIL